MILFYIYECSETNFMLLHDLIIINLTAYMTGIHLGIILLAYVLG